MPHYFFHVRDGRSAPDTAGLCIETLADLRREAIRRAALLLFDPAGRVSIPPGWHLDVTDQDGALVFRLAFPEGPAPGGARSGAPPVRPARP